MLSNPHQYAEDAKAERTMLRRFAGWCWVIVCVLLVIAVLSGTAGV